MNAHEREVLAYIELNRLVAKGTLRDRFPNCNIDEVLSGLESAGLVSHDMIFYAPGRERMKGCISLLTAAMLTV